MNNILSTLITLSLVPHLSFAAGTPPTAATPSGVARAEGLTATAARDEKELKAGDAAGIAVDMENWIPFLPRSIEWDEKMFEQAQAESEFHWDASECTWSGIQRFGRQERTIPSLTWIANILKNILAESRILQSHVYDTILREASTPQPVKAQYAQIKDSLVPAGSQFPQALWGVVSEYAAVIPDDVSLDRISTAAFTPDILNKIESMKIAYAKLEKLLKMTEGVTRCSSNFQAYRSHGKNIIRNKDDKDVIARWTSKGWLHAPRGTIINRFVHKYKSRDCIASGVFLWDDPDYLHKCGRHKPLPQNVKDFPREQRFEGILQIYDSHAYDWPSTDNCRGWHHLHDILRHAPAALAYVSSWVVKAREKAVQTAK